MVVNIVQALEEIIILTAILLIQREKIMKPWHLHSSAILKGF